MSLSSKAQPQNNDGTFGNKVDWDDVERRLRSGEKPPQIAKDLGVSSSTIYNIQQKRGLVNKKHGNMVEIQLFEKEMVEHLWFLMRFFQECSDLVGSKVTDGMEPLFGEIANFLAEKNNLLDDISAKWEEVKL